MTVETNRIDPPMDGKGKSSKKKKFFSYVFLPGIGGEIKQLARGNFGYLAYLIALIYQLVRILPSNHPYAKPENIGRFGIRQVVAAAANNIIIDRKNIDQIIVFAAILAGLVLVVLQAISFLFFIFMGSAFAGGPDVNLFVTANPQEDIAFHMIREVFGLPEMFGILEGGPTAIHEALHMLFRFYNYAILFVAVIVFLYYVVVVVAETAQTGVPFGQRFSHIYAPIRLVIAIGLLVPLNFGFNGAQYMAFHAAKLGSSFATSGWIRFNAALTGSNPLGVQQASLIAQPNVPDVTGLVQTMSVIVACREAYQLREVGVPAEGAAPIPIEERYIRAYFVDDAGAAQDLNLGAFITMRDQAWAAGKKAHVSVYFGVPERQEAYCGEIKIPIQERDKPSLNLVGLASPAVLQQRYFILMWQLWVRADLGLEFIGQRMALAHFEGADPCQIQNEAAGDCALTYRPAESFKQTSVSIANDTLEIMVNRLFADVRTNINYQIEDEVLETGWGGAGIWYNKIAQVNGSYVSVVNSVPNLHKWPQAMQNVLDKKIKSDEGFNDCKGYEPNLSKDKAVKFEMGQVDGYYASVFNDTYQYWRCERPSDVRNFFWDAMSAVFGLNGLFSIRGTIDVPNPEGTGTIATQIHPLAQLSSIGKSLVDAAVRNMAMAMGMSFGGGMFGALSQHLGAGLQSASQMFVSIATIGLSVGFILYYILPFLPFMYFFFAVGGWVKGLFEAMVGTPLWALAHLRIDGDGLPGRSAMSGYLLIFEIFLRPILTVFGLIGGLAIFTTSAIILNEIFDLAVTNVTGNKIGVPDENQAFGRHIVDEFFFTVVYAIILYMMAIASFKMITLVPNNILRWIGQSVSTFNDSAQDPTAGLTQYAAMGGARIGGQLAGGATQLSTGAGSAIGETAAFGLRSGGKGP